MDSDKGLLRSFRTSYSSRICG